MSYTPFPFTIPDDEDCYSGRPQSLINQLKTTVAYVSVG
jgi:hypothetical protein